MNTRLCGFSSYASSASEEERMVALGGRSRSLRAPPSSSALVRVAVRISRARWFSFLRRVFHYQNGSSSDLGSNPFNSSAWIMLEFMALTIQISLTSFTLAISKKERPVWPMRVWIVGYDIGCLLSLLLLYGRYRHLYLTFSDVELQNHRGSSSSSSSDETATRCSHLMNRCRTSLELFFAIWFVMGNVWVFDSRFDSFERAPNLHVLCISLLAWNALCYSFPFLLFLLLCCCVPLMSTLLGYNMNTGSSDRGASDDQISSLPSWSYKEEEEANNGDEECCCICLAKYREKEEVRKLPCSHIFHLKCVDQWLTIISCCPLCKQQLDK